MTSTSADGYVHSDINSASSGLGNNVAPSSSHSSDYVSSPPLGTSTPNSEPANINITAMIAGIISVVILIISVTICVTIIVLIVRMRNKRKLTGHSMLSASSNASK